MVTSLRRTQYGDGVKTAADGGEGLWEHHSQVKGNSTVIHHVESALEEM